MTINLTVPVLLKLAGRDWFFTLIRIVIRKMQETGLH